MGAFLVAICVIFISILISMGAGTGPDAVLDAAAMRPTIQAVAGNLVEVHQAAVNFVTQTANKTPSSTTWSFTVSSQGTVRCTPYTGATYPANSSSGTCTAPTTEFKLPSYISDTSPLYNWNIYYKSGSPGIVVTYASSGASPGGYSSTEVARALSDYSLSSNSGWYWGVTPSSAPYTLSNGTISLTLPAGYTTGSTVAIATTIP